MERTPHGRSELEYRCSRTPYVVPYEELLIQAEREIEAA
jgi:hypothetical protein